MKFELFKDLYTEALEEESLEYYIAERGWQDWMDDYSTSEVATILNQIYTLANSNIKDSREISQIEYARRFAVPKRTIQNWEAETTIPPAYVKLLLSYAYFNSDIEPKKADGKSSGMSK